AGARWADAVARALPRRGGERAVALDHERRVAAEPDALPERMAGHQDQIGAAQGESAHATGAEAQDRHRLDRPSSSEWLLPARSPSRLIIVGAKEAWRW